MGALLTIMMVTLWTLSTDSVQFYHRRELFTPQADTYIEYIFVKRHFIPFLLSFSVSQIHVVMSIMSVRS